LRAVDEVVLTHGTRLVLDGGRVGEVIDRRGRRLARIAWRDGVMSSAMVEGVVVSDAIVAHPVLGPAHALSCGAVMSAIDWTSPRRIPAIDRPAAIPPGAGTMLLDLIALCASRAGVASLRYDGPYPTHALWGSLAQCFSPRGSMAAFVAGAPVDFAPAPFERVHVHSRAWVQLRDALERASIDGRDYARGSSARRLVDLDDGTIAAEFWIGDAPLARLAIFDGRGDLLGEPAAPPPFASSVIGRDFPPPLRDALADLVADLAPSPLTSAVRDLIASTPLRWADLGVDLSRATDTAIEVHAALWDRLAPLGLARVALALAEAIAPVAIRLAVSRAG
jgi:hypothetical protein